MISTKRTVDHFSQPEIYDAPMRDIHSLFTFHNTSKIHKDNHNSTPRTIPVINNKRQKLAPEPVSSLFTSTKKQVHESREFEQNDHPEERRKETIPFEQHEANYTVNPATLKINSLFSHKQRNSSTSLSSNVRKLDYKSQYQYLKNLTNDKINYYLNFDFNDVDHDDELDEGYPQEIKLIG